MSAQVLLLNFAAFPRFLPFYLFFGLLLLSPFTALSLLERDDRAHELQGENFRGLRLIVILGASLEAFFFAYSLTAFPSFLMRARCGAHLGDVLPPGVLVPPVVGFLAFRVFVHMEHLALMCVIASGM